MVKNRMRLKYRAAAFLVILCALSLLLCLKDAPLLALDRFIKYLPRNEDMGSTFKDYGDTPRTLNEVFCQSAADLFKDADNCDKCVGMLQVQCPNCCLNLVKRVYKCSVADGYNCPNAAFLASGCPRVASGLGDDLDVVCSSEANMAVKNHFQARGCASTEPNGHCTSDGNNWLCREGHLDPKFKGCASGASGCSSPCNFHDYYIVEAIDQPPYSHLYRPTPEFLSCVQNCKKYTNDRDTCNNRRDCCFHTTCSSLGPGGFSANCSDQVSCDERIAFPACDNYTAQTCADLREQATKCLVEGACDSCFREIDPDFSYRFVAKSREAMTLVWQISTVPTIFKNTRANFYTKLRIFAVQPDGGLESHPVHSSMIHQKSLEAAFSIFCATNIPAGALQQGKAYVAKVYYFLAENDAIDLKTDLNSVQIIFIKNRE